MGVHTEYTNGLGKHVIVEPETLIRVCAAAGASISAVRDAADALRAHHAAMTKPGPSLVVVAWEGKLPPLTLGDEHSWKAELQLEDGGVVKLERTGSQSPSKEVLPLGYHRLTIESRGRKESSTVIAAPVKSWRRPGSQRSWGVAGQLAALRSARSRSVGDVRDLQALCDWVRGRGGDVVTLLPLLPTFNAPPPEPSPYSPVSRLFWSEIILDLGDAHRASPSPGSLDVMLADQEVRDALAAHAAPDSSQLDEELVRYARFRGAQARLGREWRTWPANARGGAPDAGQIDADEERFHLVAQTMVRRQLRDARSRLDADGFRLGLDLAVGVHPDGYDPWSRQALFADGMSVGAPPDGGFPSGQDWGFAPVLPGASRQEGHRYLAASIAHQARLAGILRVDHIMAWTRLYWIPHGLGLHQGTYVSYPAEELFAVLALESARHRCEILGENLGTVPPEIDEALPRHRIWSMYLAQFEASESVDVSPPGADDVALIGTHDTPTFGGWIAGNDIGERVRYGLLAADAAPGVAEERRAAVQRLAERLQCAGDTPREFLMELLEWLGRSATPLVVPWLEDLWLEETAVNLPGTPSSVRPNWQRPMSRVLDEVTTDPLVDAYVRRLNDARIAAAISPATSQT